MLLRFGSSGPHVKSLQQSLNLLPPTRFAALAEDGIFGGLTKGRVQEFQGQNKLTPDGIVGPQTTEFIHQLLDRLGLGKTMTSDVTVTPITQEVLGMAGDKGLIQQFVPSIPIVNVASFRRGDINNVVTFTHVPMKTARLGIYAVGKAGVERSIILLLPGSATPKRVMIGVSHQFSQARAHYDGLGWSNPRSAALINFVLLKHVLNRWGAEVLTAPEPTALFHIVRAGDGTHELGPFANDGSFVKEALEKMAEVTGNAFSFSAVQAFTFSNGIFDFNPFLKAIGGSLNVTRIVSIDPRYAVSSKRPSSNTVLRQYLSGHTHPAGGPMPGFEFMPYERWKNEAYHHLYRDQFQFQYMHDHVLPLYTLSLGMRS